MPSKLLALFFVLLFCPIVSLADIMTVSFSGTEMRSAPNGMSSNFIAKVSTYTPLEVLKKGPEDYKVKDYRGSTGWVHRALLSSKLGIVVTGDLANVRQGPGTNHAVIFQLA